MIHIFAFYRWFIAHPVELIATFAVVLAVSFVIGALVFAIWQAHEERKQEAERQRFERILLASEPREWPPKAGPKAGAWKQKRRVS